jgi:lipopolysaccharide export LptBFGC system permease protein LptF
MIKPFLAGANVVAAVVVAMFFWRFMKQTRDRFFGFFALAFLLLSVEQFCRHLRLDEGSYAEVYLPRLGAFLLILYAIIDKNRSDHPAETKTPNPTKQ